MLFNENREKNWLPFACIREKIENPGKKYLGESLAKKIVMIMCWRSVHLLVVIRCDTLIQL